MVSHPVTGSDPPIGLDHESGRDKGVARPRHGVAEMEDLASLRYAAA